MSRGRNDSSIIDPETKEFIRYYNPPKDLVFGKGSLHLTTVIDGVITECTLKSENTCLGDCQVLPVNSLSNRLSVNEKPYWDDCWEGVPQSEKDEKKSGAWESIIQRIALRDKTAPQKLVVPGDKTTLLVDPRDKTPPKGRVDSCTESSCAETALQKLAVSEDKTAPQELVDPHEDTAPKKVVDPRKTPQKEAVVFKIAVGRIKMRQVTLEREVYEFTSDLAGVTPQFYGYFTGHLLPDKLRTAHKIEIAVLVMEHCHGPQAAAQQEDWW